MRELSASNKDGRTALGGSAYWSNLGIWREYGERMFMGYTPTIGPFVGILTEIASAHRRSTGSPPDRAGTSRAPVPSYYWHPLRFSGVWEPLFGTSFGGDAVEPQVDRYATLETGTHFVAPPIP